MNIEKMREGFEAWVKREKNAYFLGRTDSPACWNGDDDEIKAWEYNPYDHPWTHGAWDGWQASRAALVIELPEKDPAGSGGGDCGDGRPSEEQYVAAHCNIVLAQCRKAIEAVGVKVKP